jgi:hypothetical protein
LALSGLLFFIGRAARAKLKSRFSRFVFAFVASIVAFPALLFDVYYLHLFDGWIWFHNLRALENSELLAAGAGLIGGFIHRSLEPVEIGEHLLIPVLLLTTILVPFAKPLLSPVNPDKLMNKCRNEVCLQSSPSTCGPASAASVLHYLGQPGEERELAQESLTSNSGTENWYLARSLRKRGVIVEARHMQPGEVGKLGPAIAGVRLKGGSGHFIAVLERNGQKVTIVDPLRGKLSFEVNALIEEYRFTGFFLQIVDSVNRFD